MLEKVTLKLVRRALSQYLPDLHTNIVRRTEPVATHALRVWLTDEDPYDYFVNSRWWWSISAHRDGVKPTANNTGVATGTGQQVISAVVAFSAATRYRVLRFRSHPIFT
jgi:hypothetical protein